MVGKTNEKHLEMHISITTETNREPENTQLEKEKHLQITHFWVPLHGPNNPQKLAQSNQHFPQ